MLWNQLKQLEASCQVKIESLLDRSSTLCWRITITPQDGHTIVVQRPDITHAVRAGLEEARKAGLLRRQAESSEAE